MQATNIPRGFGISKRAVALVAAVGVALLLGGASGYVVKSATTATPVAHNRATVTSAESTLGVDNYKALRTGAQPGEDESTVAQPVIQPSSTRPGGPRS
jgi:hypothetical protein